MRLLVILLARDLCLIITEKKDFEFLHKDCFFTEESVMTVAIANALMTCKDYKDLSEETIKNMLNIGRRYPYSGYCSHFLSWIFGDEQKPLMEVLEMARQCVFLLVNLLQNLLKRQRVYLIKLLAFRTATQKE